MAANPTLLADCDRSNSANRVKDFTGHWSTQPNNIDLINKLIIPCNLVLKALRTLATPLILLAVLNSFLTTYIPGRAGRRLALLLFINTLVAILIGLLVTNVLQPGIWGNLAPPSGTAEEVRKTLDPWVLLEDNVLTSVLQPLVDNNVIQLVIIALAFGIALRGLKAELVAHGIQVIWQLSR